MEFCAKFSSHCNHHSHTIQLVDPTPWYNNAQHWVMDETLFNRHTTVPINSNHYQCLHAHKGYYLFCHVEEGWVVPWAGDGRRVELGWLTWSSCLVRLDESHCCCCCSGSPDDTEGGAEGGGGTSSYILTAVAAVWSCAAADNDIPSAVTQILNYNPLCAVWDEMGGISLTMTTTCRSPAQN